MPFTKKHSNALVLLTAFAVIVGALALLVLNTWQAFGEARVGVAQVKHTNEVLGRVSQISDITLIEESVLRGFVVSGNKTDLTQQATEGKTRSVAVQQLQTLTVDNTLQQARLTNLKALLRERQDWADQLIAVRETQGFEAARQISMSPQLNESRERLRRTLTQIGDEERRLLKLRREAYEEASRKATLMYQWTLLVLLALLVLTTLILWRQFKTRNEQKALELNNHALAVEKAAAEQASQAKGEFLATMSHEIRTPMSSLLSLLELLSHSPLKREQSEMVEIARDSGRSMVRIIDDILDHAKIQAGKLQIVLEPVSLGHLLTRVSNNYSAQASSKGLDLRHVVDPRISVGLMADQHRLMQVLGNLINNAIKFTSEGFVEVRADFKAREGNRETVVLIVRDTGIGMSEEMRQRLFQPFEQADTGTSRLYGGTGLGLVISRKLTEMMGGEMQVQSEPNMGTSFSLTFHLTQSDEVPVGQTRESVRPLVAASSATTVQTSAPPLNEGAAIKDQLSPSSQGAWVLAVDDNQTNRILIQRQLQMLGFRVRTATDGDQALDLWQSSDYALVLTDINMATRNGYELARAIRGREAEQGRPRTPILGWTANAMADTLARCKAAGMDDVLHKPSDLPQLSALLTRWLPADQAPMSAATTQAIDMQLLQESFGSDQDKLKTLLPTIRKTLAEQVTAMNTALKASDLPTLKELGHNMSGSAGLMGAQALFDVCRRIEAQADSGDVAGLSELAQQFQAEAQRTLDALGAMG